MKEEEKCKVTRLRRKRSQPWARGGLSEAWLSSFRTLARCSHEIDHSFDVNNKRSQRSAGIFKTSLYHKYESKTTFAAHIRETSQASASQNKKGKAKREEQGTRMRPIHLDMVYV